MNLANIVLLITFLVFALVTGHLFASRKKLVAEYVLGKARSAFPHFQIFRKGGKILVWDEPKPKKKREPMMAIVINCHLRPSIFYAGKRLSYRKSINASSGRDIIESVIKDAKKIMDGR